MTGYLVGVPGSGAGGGASAPFLPQDPLGSTRRAMKMDLDFFVQGDDGRDLVTDTALTAIGGATADSTTTALRDGEPPPPNVTGALDSPGVGAAWQAWDNTVNQIAAGSALLVVTFWLRAPAAGSQNIAAKTTVDNGVELFIDVNQQINCHVRVLGNPIRVVKLPGIFATDRWHTVACLIDRTRPSALNGGQLVLAGTNESSSRAANEIATDLEPGDLTNASVWAWGAQRIPVSANMLGLCVATASGAQVEGRNPRLIAGSVAQATWAEPVFGGITP